MEDQMDKRFQGNVAAAEKLETVRRRKRSPSGKIRSERKRSGPSNGRSDGREISGRRGGCIFPRSYVL
jgi:hypothetical protein